jgi:hypothetical protein
MPGINLKDKFLAFPAISKARIEDRGRNTQQSIQTAVRYLQGDNKDKLIVLLNYLNDGLESYIIIYLFNMDAFFLCWTFDSRWLFTFKNPCQELLLTFPLLIDIMSICGILVERAFYDVNSNDFLPELIIMLGLLAVINLFIILTVHCIC